MNTNYQKHLSFEDRLKIEEEISKRLHKSEIAKSIDKATSSFQKSHLTSLFSSTRSYFF